MRFSKLIHYIRRRSLLVMIIGILFLLTLGFLYFSRESWSRGELGEQSMKFEGYETKTITLEGQSYKVLVADTDETRTRGLMYVRKPFAYDGMIFLFPKASIHRFWNMNTYEDLTLYFLREGRVVDKQSMPSIEKSKEVTIVTPREEADAVVEIINK